MPPSTLSAANTHVSGAEGVFQGDEKLQGKVSPEHKQSPPGAGTHRGLDVEFSPLSVSLVKKLGCYELCYLKGGTDEGWHRVKWPSEGPATSGLKPTAWHNGN